MTNKYVELDLDDAEAGLVLATAVRDHQGSVLLPAGAALTATLLTSMRRRGIDSVQVVNDAVSDQELAAERERVGERFRHLFRHSHPGAADALLRAQLLAYRMEGVR